MRWCIIEQEGFIGLFGVTDYFRLIDCTYIGNQIYNASVDYVYCIVVYLNILKRRVESLKSKSMSSEKGKQENLKLKSATRTFILPHSLYFVLEFLNQLLCKM